MTAVGYPIVSFHDGEFFCVCTYADREIPKGAKFYWNARRKVWMTTSARCAARLMQYCDASARRAIVDKLTWGLGGGGGSHSRIQREYRYNA